MITEFTDRRPTLSAFILVGLCIVLPIIFTVTVNILAGNAINSAAILFFYALVIQVVLLLKVERPALIILPFICALLGFIICEIIYTVSMGMSSPGIGPSALVYYLSSVIVIVFGAESAGMIAGLFVYILITILRKLWDAVTRR